MSVSGEFQRARSVQRILDNDDTMKDYHIHFLGDLSLFQVTKGGSEYRGLVTAKTQRGTEVPVEVTAFADKDTLMYEIDAASEMRLQQMANKEACGSWSPCR